ncbi:MAG TPA: 2TM domain-containing protein [Alphaproteobacteria bacterium]|nr:2TM domain-containing protein [Alphaproteobacteria bacterium]
MNEQNAREYVSKLRRFYTDALIYVVVNLGLILIWAIAGGGTFWPIWVIVGWGIGLGVHAFSLGLIPQINGVVPFMTDEWEEAQIRHLMQEKEIKKTQAKRAEVKRAAAKKAEVKKVEVKVAVKPTSKPKPKTTAKKPKAAKGRKATSKKPSKPAV